MSLMRYGPSPGSLFDQWFDWPSRIVREMFRDSPAITLEEDEDQLVARVEVPGVDPDRLEVIVHDTSLTVRGEEGEEEQEGEYTRRRQRAFSRTIALPRPVQAEAASATCRHGVLTVTMPLREPERRGHRIPIRSDEGRPKH